MICDVIIMMTSLWRHNKNDVIMTSWRQQQWRHNVDDVINFLLLSRPTTGVSFISSKLIDKNGNIVFVTWLLCILQTRIGKLQTFYIFGSINAIDVKLIPVVVLDKKPWFMTSSSWWHHYDVTIKITSLWRHDVINCDVIMFMT